MAATAHHRLDFFTRELPGYINPELLDYIVHRPQLFPVSQVEYLQRWFRLPKEMNIQTEHELLNLVTFVKAAKEYSCSHASLQQVLINRNDSVQNPSMLTSKRRRFAVGAKAGPRC